MAVSHTDEYRAQKRNERRSTVRQSLFASEYIKCKYPDIYKEVGLMYNELNNIYPKKPDLRKCREFREWRNDVSVQRGQQTTIVPREKLYKYTRTGYNNMVINPVNEPPPEKQPQRTMCLNIELMPPPDCSTVHETVIEEGDVQESIHTPDPTPQEPLDQITDLSTIDMDEIAPEVMEKIIDELRRDPQLNSLMDDVETQIEEQTVGLEVDIPELDYIMDQDDIFW